MFLMFGVLQVTLSSTRETHHCQIDQKQQLRFQLSMAREDSEENAARAGLVWFLAAKFASRRTLEESGPSRVQGIIDGRFYINVSG